MKIIKRKIHINANVEHVYKYIGDINYFYGELLKLNDNKNIKIKLKENILEFIDKETLFTLTVQKPDNNYQFKALFTPVAFHIKRFGSGYVTCTLTNSNSGTNMITELESVKNPGFIWRVFIKIAAYIMLMQSKSYEKQFISSIEQSA